MATTASRPRLTSDHLLHQVRALALHKVLLQMDHLRGMVSGAMIYIFGVQFVDGAQALLCACVTSRPALRGILFCIQ